MDKIGEQIKMSKNVHSVIQILMTAAQAVNGLAAFIPGNYKIWIAVGLSAIQGVIGVLNHFDTTTPTTPTNSANPLG